MRRALRPARPAALLLVLVLCGACALPGGPPVPVTGDSAGAGGSPAAAEVGPAVEDVRDAPYAVAEPAALRGRPVGAALLAVSQRTLPGSLVRRVKRLPGVRASLTLSLVSAPVDGRTLTLAAADPGVFRRFTPPVAARNDAVWQRVAEGDLALSPTAVEHLRLKLGGRLVLGDAAGSRALRVGASVTMPRKVDALVNPLRGADLGMVPGNAMLVAVGDGDLVDVAAAIERQAGRRVTVASLTGSVPEEGQQTATLTGGAVADAVGSFRYRWFPDGSVAPDPAWVGANIRTETVPILGPVTCHRAMLPQLRGALQEVVDAGLADRIDPGDYGGCYVPRFIARDPAKGLSLHTWGIAVDLNVAGNQRGTVGEIDRRVVAVFKRWGFAWGGDWAWTDPMHFEMAAVVRPTPSAGR